MICDATTVIAAARSMNLPHQITQHIKTYLLCQWANASGSSISCTLFDTGLIAAGAGYQTFNHGFSRTPPIVLPVTVCVANDAATGYLAGDEVPLYMWRTQEEIGAPWAISLVLANSTIVAVSTNSFAIGNEGNLWVWNKTSATRAVSNPSSMANWRLKVRCFDCDGIVAAGPWDQTNANTTINHGLAGKPSVCLCVIRCKQADALNNFDVGDEVPGWMFLLEQFQGYHWVNSTVDGIFGFANLQSQSWVKGTDYATTLLPNMAKYEKWVYNLL